MAMFDERFIIYTCILFVLWIIALFSFYLDLRQRRVVKTTTALPDDLKEMMEDEAFHKSRLYNLEKLNFTLIKNVWDLVHTTVLLQLAAIPWLWTECERQLISFGLSSGHSDIWTCLLFMSYATIYMTLEQQPFSIYFDFVIEAKHGFNKQTPWFYVKDVLKGVVLNVVISFPLVLAIIKVIEWGGSYFFIYASLLVTLFMFFIMFIYPDFIAPLFDRYEPLEDGDLKDRITALAQSIAFPLKKIFVVEGSKRSNHSNAYFYGFWKNKRIVLFDTLIEGYVMGESNIDQSKESMMIDDESIENIRKKGCDTMEIVAIMGHELGHWKLNHFIYNIAIIIANTFFMFYCLSLFFDVSVLYEAFGCFNCSTLVKLIIVSQLCLPYGTVMQLFMVWLSRKFEYQADKFSFELGYGETLISGLKKLGLDNLSFPVNDSLYATFNFSHPTLRERIQRLRELEQLQGKNS